MDKITILTCEGSGKKATKVFRKHEDGRIEKRSFDAGRYFTYEEKDLNSLSDLGAALEMLLDKPNKFIIRGAPKKDAGKIVRRKTHPPKAAFDAASRRYVMFDFDKVKCPDYFDAVKNPTEIVSWVRATLPLPFKKASCYYKFSSSQDISSRESVSLHLWFWLEQAVSDDELKRYSLFPIISFSTLS